MPATPDLRPALLFLDELARHNQRDWFEAHRSDYEAARGAFEGLIGQVITAFRQADGLGELAARDCVARLHRDVRFSKDKSPYKTNLAALVAPGGWRATAHGYFFHLEPGGRSLLGGGLHDPSPAQLDSFRRAVAQDPAAFRKATGGKVFTEIFGEIVGERLKTAPRGWDPAHPEIATLRLKQVLAVRYLSDEQMCAPDLAAQLIRGCRALRPFLDWLTANGI
ncbi:MAG: DUF2461 domain-containing protein [Candidatus Delongbacteria bacterium]